MPISPLMLFRKDKRIKTRSIAYTEYNPCDTKFGRDAICLKMMSSKQRFDPGQKVNHLSAVDIDRYKRDTEKGVHRPLKYEQLSLGVRIRSDGVLYIV